jgi:hypothetical protein
MCSVRDPQVLLEVKTSLLLVWGVALTLEFIKCKNVKVGPSILWKDLKCVIVVVVVRHRRRRRRRPSVCTY